MKFVFSECLKKNENGKRGLDFVELKLQKLIEQNVPSKRDIIKLVSLILLMFLSQL